MRYAILLLLAGCATTGYPEIDYSNAPPSDWPTLKQEVRYGSEAQVRTWCGSHQPPQGTSKVGCALVYFDSGICRVFLSSDDPRLVKHEKDHCLGYVHHGEGNKARRALEKWKAQRK